MHEVCAPQSCSFSYSYFASQKPLSVTGFKELLLVIAILDLRILLVLLLVVILYLVLVIAICYWLLVKGIGFLHLFYKYKYCFLLFPD